MEYLDKVLVIIPAFNEEANIEGVVEELVQKYPELDYVVVNESSSRREYLDDVTLKNAAMRHCGVWGGLFKISGDISAKGVLKITSIEKGKEQ